MNDLANRYLTPSGLDTIMNRVFKTLPGLGLGVGGSRVLAVRGRKSGEWRTTMVNLLIVDDTRYLVAPRGHTDWVKNLRAAGGGELRLGRKAEPFTARELSDAEKLPALHAYLDRWGWELGRFFEGLDKNSSDAELAAIAPGFPVFQLS
ncbi:nitroreductase family deazaflavin-dependent oxidoreductase [Nocardia sp. SYP-A9097]|uniref:nitroreductase family deazaflavin-dependent oxidoreductase n=1 Tax=Nocardia sp. SYP-A9097 TaxID=2663237 RepID=UPI00129A57D2|nr:nitroreductase family deazaflavin-dependent oxidoreductase [Nocardia sp. SYP-A9097]MRH88541.1 nitroreductase family deazaflavin-dependent oxidoreductase [Nocardia sp. SYP-A9097]